MIEGLPSGPAAPDETLDGPNGLALAGQVLFIANGEGDKHKTGPRPGTIVPNPDGRSSPIYSSVLKVTFSTDVDRILTPFRLAAADHYTLADGAQMTLADTSGDKAVVELLTDLRDNIPDARTIYRNSHPYGLALHPSRPDSLYVADAGMNTVWEVSLSTGRAKTLTRFQEIATGIPGRPVAEAVPTSVRAYGTDILITLLSGVPFVPGTSQVQIANAATGQTDAFINGLSSATDIVWEQKENERPIFYVLEFSAGLSQTPPLPGRIKRFDTPEGTVFVNGLRTPTSMALDSPGRALYVTERSTGTIVKVRPLRTRRVCSFPPPHTVSLSSGGNPPLSRIGMAIRAFFSILGGSLPWDIAQAFGFSRTASSKAAEPAKEAAVKPSDGALQLLGIMQRDARLLDFFLEDIAAYSDDQVGAAVRNIHFQCQDTLKKYFKFAPVIDGVEGTFSKPESAGQLAKDPAAIKFIGNLPPQGKPAGGTLRHKGWRVDSHSLPSPAPRQNLSILAPAELEVE